MLLLMHLIVLSLKGDAWHLIALQRAVLVTSIAAAVMAASQEVLPHFEDHVAVVLMMHLIFQKGIFGIQLLSSTSSICSTSSVEQPQSSQGLLCCTAQYCGNRAFA